MAVKKKKTREEEDSGPPLSAGSLRDAAEKKLAHSLPVVPGMKGQTAEELIHELQVHQIELEMQADELRRAQISLMESRDDYLDLYDFAPLGYLALTDKALISRANLTAAVLLGIDRSKLVDARFRKWIVPEDQDIWDRYFTNLLQSERRLTTTLMLKRGDRATFPARLEGIRLTGSSDRATTIRIAISDISDIRMAEKALRESEHCLKSVMEILPVGVWIQNAKGEIISGNTAGQRIWAGACYVGIEQFGEYKGWWLDSGKLIKPHEWAAARAIERGETTLDEQIEIECFDGIHRIISNSALPIRRSDGSIRGAIIVNQDITGRKAAEERIRWLASFPELNPDPVIEMDAEGSIMFANPATATVLSNLGLPDNPSAFIPDDKEEILRLIHEGTQSQIYREVSLGSEIFAENIALDHGLRVARIYARNITKRKRVDDALKESESFNRNLVENLPDYIIVYGPEGKILYVNPAAVKALGYPAGDLIGTPLLSVVAEEYRDFVIRRMGVRPEKGQFSPYEIDLLTRDGLRRSVIVKGTPDQHHGSPAVLLLLTDISDRKALEEDLTLHTDELSRISAAYRIANKKLQLLSSITRHDINNQLTVLLGYLALIQDPVPQSELKEYIPRIAAAGNRISAMITFTKTYDSIGVDAPAWHNIRTLVRTATKDVSLGKVTIDNDLPAGTEIFTDPLIVKVFFNLMDNAVRYGEKITTIRFSGMEQGGDYVIIGEDDGVGIPADQKEKIFDRGYGKNTGLGLFLAREILAITGITIRETGEPGKGARFEIRVPKDIWRKG